ncbi:P-loop containing nucleoside triphosphate hydrolase protein [Saccharata proteae CBS 121410]|uniref:Pre-mRNA-splicing factor n=1 Tax=Saccharata proteae CBS 121410 TaxID=1314787 RepID=A0A9P4LV78_9PEZI|nr:P-loop containing nucleoside triphosphate hydrolase protein [Saccharata proteae CBS 121410]
MDVDSSQTRSGPLGNARPTVADLHGDNQYAAVARKYWLNAKNPPKVSQEVLKEELWSNLEKEDFAFGSLLVLENLQLLEKYLWPGYSDDASNHHVLLLALVVNVKRRENLPSWDHFADKPSDFSSFFRRVLSMTIDQSLSLKVRSHLIQFVIGAFQSLDNGIVRKECAPLVNIGLWHNLHSNAVREEKLEQNAMLRKSWRAATKRYDAGDDEVKTKLRFERGWLYTLLLDLLDRTYDEDLVRDSSNLLYCERFVEFVTDLQSQLPTRRFVNTLVQDTNFIPALKLSDVYTYIDNGLFRDLVNLLEHYTYFPIDDQTAQQQSAEEYHQAHCAKLTRLQRIAIKNFKDKLMVLALSNYASLDSRKELEGHLAALSDEEIVELCKQLGLRTEYPKQCMLLPDREFYVELIVAAHQRRPTFQDSVRETRILPTEQTLYESVSLRTDTYNGSRPLAIPKLNLQYLTMGDFLWRSFVLHRCETFYEIRKDMEDVIKRLRRNNDKGASRTGGFARMALPISKPAVTDVGLANVGELVPSKVQAEIILDVSRLNYNIRKEWESLRSDDVAFLLSVDESEQNGNGHLIQSEAEKAGIKHLRCAEVIHVLDDNGRVLREQDVQRGAQYRARQRRLLVKLDAAAYQEDMDRVAKGEPNIYDSMNLIVRRRGRENNFKPILESIKRLTLSDIPAPSWLQEVFLGYGDPAGATWKRLSNRLKSIDFRDTFLDWQHLIASLPTKNVEVIDGESIDRPPYVVEFATETTQEAPARSSKKRRKDLADVPQEVEKFLVSTYKPPNMGPYPADAPKLNTVRFTPAQVEAIISGSQPGLTVIVGPPGTGKTDVATQIINNIYHNFPEQRTLLIAHSNQALNQLFQKIVALDIDERHLLRLGHGEEDLETEANYSKHGRVESFLENGARYLAEVNRLAANFNAPGAHGNSCETAGYFNQVYVKPAWTKYWDKVQSNDTTVEEIVSEFPLHQYFSNAPQPLFPPDAPKEDAIDIAAGCYRHVEKIFSELEDIRPFEILRNSRDKANYLLIKEARIIAMTSTHAAMRRQEIANLGFHYDNVIMEEAAQITEIENFTPLALQKPKDGQLPLQRVILCGDHLQNSPVVQNLAFRQYANLEQSLFLRLVRLGVPTIMLDQQGRARPSIAELYKWRYPKLETLDLVKSLPEFAAANPGFRHEYQFIDVPEYKGKGEMEPSPHFIQNLGEAEYAVAIFMYMRLLGYPGSRISILTTYAGQRALIRDVLAHRCKDNRLFGMPRIVTTVDKYQGEQNDYVILSLVRTARVGYLRDIRRLTVALSRARLGLYILGRRSVFESAYELKPAFDMLLRRPTKLSLVTGEMYGGVKRRVDEEQGVQSTEMEGVEHLGQYVFEMTKAKVEALKRGGGVLPAVVEEPVDVDMDKEDELDGDEEEEEFDGGVVDELVGEGVDGVDG